MQVVYLCHSRTSAWITHHPSFLFCFDTFAWFSVQTKRKMCFSCSCEVRPRLSKWVVTLSMSWEESDSTLIRNQWVPSPMMVALKQSLPLCYARSSPTSLKGELVKVLSTIAIVLCPACKDDKRRKIAISLGLEYHYCDCLVSSLSRWHAAGKGGTYRKLLTADVTVK